ncbi:Unconventional myosin-Id [Blomia tropicalis]|nr:Unconventional myosin-Id [Blomia tropicalis]
MESARQGNFYRTKYDITNAMIIVMANLSSLTVVDNIKNLYSHSKIGYDDVLQIYDLNFDNFLHNLRIRYENGIYYTYVGDVCVSVNPNRTDMNIYGTDYMDSYYGKRFDQMSPHIFAVANRAYQQTFDKNDDTCILITGESGSGKTEASKLILLFITHIRSMLSLANDLECLQTKQTIVKIETILLKSNYILEAFGNAQTSRNFNSSRFGKYTEIFFDCNSKQIAGLNDQFHAVIHNYLLEKTRVVAQQNGERNFHFFYQLLASIRYFDSNSEDFFEELGLNWETKYHYLNESTSIPTEQDLDQFQIVNESMNLIGFSDEQRMIILKLVAAILHLGNVDIEQSEDEDGCAVVWGMENLHLKYFCHLLSLDLVSTLETLTHRCISIHGEVVNKPYRQSEAINGRDSLAKSLYERLFSFILNHINRFLMAKNMNSETTIQRHNSIGILDIYGFEVFPTKPNMFEQFLINYFNEKLHQLFVDIILCREQALYTKEDIDWKMISYENNLPICLLMDEPYRGMFAVLDESCTMGRSNYTDQSILSEFNSRFASNDYYQYRPAHCSHAWKDETDFTIRHYAGNVDYKIEGFKEKNMDQLFVDYKQLMFSSNDPFIQEMWFDGQKLDNVNRFPMTSSKEYRNSIKELFTKLETKNQLFVQCIRPNDDVINSETDREVDRFNDQKVRCQIQYLGLVDSAHVQQAGFVRRFPYEVFFQRYRMLYDKPLNNGYILTQMDNNDHRQIFEPICRQIISNHACDNTLVAYGKTMIFIRFYSTIDQLEQARLNYLTKICTFIQAVKRGNVLRQKFMRKKLAYQILKQYVEIMRNQFIEMIFLKLKDYETEQSLICENTPIDLLEYYQLEKFDFPIRSYLFYKNDHFLNNLPTLFNHLNNWLIILKFPINYWNGKLLRLESCKIFWNHKADWGETRHPWIGNYLINSSSCKKFLQFRKLFRYNSQLFYRVLFGAYILKTNQHNLESIQALVMNNTDLFKINIDTMKIKHWCKIDNVNSISVTPDSDQLIVIHTNSFESNDIMFSLYSQTNNNSKVGEFVTILCNQFKKLTGNSLTVNFCKQIQFKLSNQMKLIESKTGGQATYNHLFPDYYSRIRNFLTLKRLRNYYLLFLLNANSTYQRESDNDKDKLRELDISSKNLLLDKRIEFEKISKDNYVLVYNVD